MSLAAWLIVAGGIFLLVYIWSEHRRRRPHHHPVYPVPTRLILSAATPAQRGNSLERDRGRSRET